MISEMDSEVKKFLIQLIDSLEEKFNIKFQSLEEHLGKTCTELGKVDNKVEKVNETNTAVARIEERLNGHLKSTDKKQLSRREWIMTVATVGSTIIAVIAVIKLLF